MKDIPLLYTSKNGGRYNTRYDRDAADTRYNQQEKLIKEQKDHNRLLKEINTSSLDYNSEERLGNILTERAMYVYDESNIITSYSDIIYAKICGYIVWIFTTLVICFLVYIGIFTNIIPTQVKDIDKCFITLMRIGFFSGLLLGFIRSISINCQRNVKEFFNENKR